MSDKETKSGNKEEIELTKEDTEKAKSKGTIKGDPEFIVE